MSGAFLSQADKLLIKQVNIANEQQLIDMVLPLSDARLTTWYLDIALEISAIS